jgi:hypothetical protein
VTKPDDLEALARCSIWPRVITMRRSAPPPPHSNRRKERRRSKGNGPGFTRHFANDHPKSEGATNAPVLIPRSHACSKVSGGSVLLTGSGRLGRTTSIRTLFGGDARGARGVTIAQVALPGIFDRRTRREESVEDGGQSA